MTRFPRFPVRHLLVSLAAATCLARAAGEAAPLALLVMDPLAKELACACVKGYAQRDYQRLAKTLGQGLGRPVTVEFSDDLAATVARSGAGRELVVVGKDSVVAHDAAKAGLPCRPLARLAGRDGSTELTGLFVVKAGDPAAGLKDLAGRRILFGPPNAAEKHAAALDALRAAGVAVPARPETRATCSDAALDLIDSEQRPAPVAVISSYALALLEGCGSIGKGDLKVIGKTAPVPFVTVFAAEAMPAAERDKLRDLLLAVKSDPALLEALESKDGFHACGEAGPAAPQGRPGACDWPGWRGPRRDGRAAWLPHRLPEPLPVVWRKATVPGALAGLCVAGGRLLAAERDLGNRDDVLRCLDAASGALLWRAAFPAPGRLDYGESPRATPLVHEGRVYLLGAFGDLRCLDLADGRLLWQRQLTREFGGKLSQWGTCSSPLLAGGLLVVNPGAPDASLAALDPATGATRWTCPGAPAAHGSLIAAEVAGHSQVIGCDAASLGGWDPRTGERLWRVVPPEEGDFLVPTPLLAGDRLIVASENNGTRLHAFDPAGRLLCPPLGRDSALAPDTATPVLAAGRLFGVHRGIHCLDPADRLRPVWRHEDEAFDEHASLIASEERVLAFGFRGELVLLDAAADECRIVSRANPFDEEVETYSHPALVGSRLFLRGGATLLCLELAP